MSAFLLKRLLAIPLVLLLLFTITFIMVRIVPGDPFAQERDIPEEVLQEKRAKYHLDKSLPAQYIYFLTRAVFHLDFGYSLKQQERTVNEIIRQHIGPSALLGVIAIIIALWIGIAAGIASALRANTLLDYSAMGSTVIGISLPTFVFGPLLQMIFSMKLGWLPLSGFDSAAHLVLPAVTLSLPFAARYARLMRAGMLDVLAEDYIRTARAKGASERILIWRHAIRGGILPVISFTGPAIASIITGSMVVETIFNIDGLGVEFVNSALNRDYPLIMGTTLIYGFFIIIFNLLSDIAYGVLDPRVRAHE